MRVVPERRPACEEKRARPVVVTHARWFRACRPSFERAGRLVCGMLTCSASRHAFCLCAYTPPLATRVDAQTCLRSCWRPCFAPAQRVPFNFNDSRARRKLLFMLSPPHFRSLALSKSQNDNKLESLPEGIFRNLPRLTSLYFVSTHYLRGCAVELSVPIRTNCAKPLFHICFAAPLEGAARWVLVALFQRPPCTDRHHCCCAAVPSSLITSRLGISFKSKRASHPSDGRPACEGAGVHALPSPPAGVPRVVPAARALADSCCHFSPTSRLVLERSRTPT
jgi:hypothetical protein